MVNNSFLNKKILNTYEFTYLINKPSAIKAKHTIGLEKIANQFPFFQSAQALLLKALYSQESFRYNSALRKTAAYTTDRSVLFDFITSGNFTTVQKLFIEEKEAFINEIKVNGFELITAISSKNENKTETFTLGQSHVSAINDVDDIRLNKTENNATLSKKLNIGAPLNFSKDEKHSFQEWLQLANFSPIERKETDPEEDIKPISVIVDPVKQKKIALIDRFIENNPKLSPAREMSKIAHIPDQTQDHSYLMTETLAKVYLEQKKYQKAIQAYEVLILKYPEKSTFFANRISDIIVLQQNNN
jgi:tetratricopeptide (TPR) repeat protein